MRLTLLAPDIVEAILDGKQRSEVTLAQVLGDNEFIAGDSFTVPDLVLGHCAGWATNAKFDIPEGPVADYMARMRARPALAQAMKRAAEAAS